MDSEKGDFFVKEYQKWVQKPLDEGLLDDLSERIDDATNKWALFVEDWALMDDGQKRAEKGNAYRAQLHYHKLMAEMYGFSFALLNENGDAKPALIPTIKENQPEASAMPMEVLSVQPTVRMMNDIIEPFLKRSPMGEATHQRLSKLRDMMEGAERCVETFKLNKFTFEPIVAYFAIRLLDEPTKIVIRMVKGDEQYSLRDVIDVVNKRLSIMAEPSDVEMKCLNTASNSETVVQSGSEISAEVKPAFSSKKNKQSGLAEQGQHYCYYCQNEHWMQKCQKYRQLKWEQRAMALLTLPICPNCFRDTHTVRDCPVGNCKQCNLPHNSLVCPKGAN